MFKRGIGHIEAILSFLLFIGFIFFGLFFFSPSSNNNIIDSSLQYTLNEISKNNSVEMFSFSIKLNLALLPAGRKSIAIEFPPEVIFIPSNYKARAETYGGIALPTTRAGDIVYVDPRGNDFVTIKFSEDFLASIPATENPALDLTYYKISSATTKTLMSEKRMLELNASYYQNYEGLKSDLNIPAQTTFGFLIQIGNYTLSGPLQVPVGVEVYSAIARREILKQNGETLFGEIGVQIW